VLSGGASMSDGAESGVLRAPVAPGRLGTAAATAELRDYLDLLGRWREGRRRELDRLDEVARAAEDPDVYSGDVTLSMALWQAVSDRYDQLLQRWDSGRADAVARERMSQLIWGRLDAGGPALGGFPGGFGVSLADACRLSDALASQLKARLSFDPRAAESAVQVRRLRAAVYRLQALVEQEPDSVEQVRDLASRVDDLGTAASEGADVSGPLAALEIVIVRLERDLIVSTAKRRQLDRDRDRAASDLVADRVRAMNEAQALERRQHHLLSLVDECVRRVVPAPRLAVPEPEALGPVPESGADVEAYLGRLAEVARAMDHVEAVYSAPVAECQELAGRLGGFHMMATRTGQTEDPRVRLAWERARDAVRAVPCELDTARALVSDYVELIRSRTRPASEATP
jgi:hypothetical protein